MLFVHEPFNMFRDALVELALGIPAVRVAVNELAEIEEELRRMSDEAVAYSFKDLVKLFCSITAEARIKLLPSINVEKFNLFKILAENSLEEIIDYVM